jgi:predicted nucleotide-binding protein (sugar kinase/HSP70/actin superfamily)
VHESGKKSIDRGVAQINDYYHKDLKNEDAFDFKKNIDYAIKLFKRSGANQWSCAKIIK